jgi:hypothetical protein
MSEQYFTRPNVQPVITNIGTTPEQRQMSTSEFKAKFDEMPEAIQQYIKETLLIELDAFKEEFMTEMPKKANKQQEGWTYPTLLNGWQNVSGSRPTRYFIDEFGIAHIFCEISGGTTASNTELFRLGNNYAPEFYTFFSCIHNNNEARLLSIRPGSGGFFIESSITGTIRFTLSIPVIPL